MPFARLAGLVKLPDNLNPDLLKVATDLIKTANDVGSHVYGRLNEGYNTLDSAVGGRLPYGVPETPQPSEPAPTRYVRASERWTDADANSPISTYINEIPDKGAFPVPTINPTMEALLTAAKYAVGPFGTNFRILRSPGTAEQLQRQIDGASVRDGKLYHGLGEPNYEETRFPSNIEGAGIVGQFVGIPGYDNKVTVNELYDTRGDGYHQGQLMDNLARRDVPKAAESVGNILFRALDDSGWANKYPRGREQVIGELNPDHPYYRGGPTSAIAPQR